MKLLLFLVLFAFSAQAQTIDVSDILARYAPSALSQSSPLRTTSVSSQQVSSSRSEFCVQNNLDNCAQLGYTETSCPIGGVACPFDPTKLSCTVWSCEDLGLFAQQPDNMTCQPVTNSTITCYKCQCGAGFINAQGCNGLVDTLMNDKGICIQLGYIHSSTSCEHYLPCPSNPNKVRCLDNIGCIETSCLPRYELPDNAIPTYGSVSCSCGGQKSVLTDWTCDEGFSQEGSKEGGSCVELSCPSGEYDNDSPLDCTPLAEGWSKIATENKSGKKTCYRCQCDVPSEYTYTEETKGEYGQLEMVACDGEHYAKCTRSCPTSVYVPDEVYGAVPDKRTCSACGSTTEYAYAWHCNEAEGWQMNSTSTACNPVDCPNPSNGSYYSLLYHSIDDCLEKINNGTGWAYEAEGAKSGGQWCGLCQCPYGEDDAFYKWSSSDNSNQNDAELSGLGCNGKYSSCTVVNDQYLSELPEHVAEGGYNTRKICGENYYQITQCEEGYTLSNNDTECLPTTCGEDFVIEGLCPEWGTCTGCNSAGQVKRKLLSCSNDNVNMIEYRISDDKLRCCQKTCDPNDTEFFIGDICPEEKPTLLETKPNDCGDTCIKCI